MKQLWIVTTEGDCEGRTTQQLGVHEGDPAIIALNLSSHACYSLEFTPVNPEKHTKVKDGAKAVSIQGFGKNPMSVDFTTPDGWVVVEGRYYDAVELVKTSSIPSLKEKALAKLTAEEIKLLGL